MIKVLTNRQRGRIYAIRREGNKSGEYDRDREGDFTSRYKKKGISRGDKAKPTKEEQEKVNTRQAERKLRILINANYGYGDHHLVLDYIRKEKEQPDRTPEQMRQDIRRIFEGVQKRSTEKQG